MMENIRLDMSGSTAEDKKKQHSTEIKKASKEKKGKLFTAADLKPPKISSDEGSALRPSMGFSCNKYRKQRWYLRSIGVEMDSEKAERNFKEDALCGEVTIEDIPLNCDCLLYTSDAADDC